MIGSFVLSLGFFFLWRSLPFLDRVGIVFLASIAIGIVITVVERAEPHPNAIDYEQVDTSTSSGFNFSALVIILILTALYATWW